MLQLSPLRRSDSGAAAILVAIVASLALFSMTALAVDLGSLRLERRELQNGAEAAAMAVAYGCSFNKPRSASCATAATSISTLAVPTAQRNALDNTANATACFSQSLVTAGTIPGAVACTNGTAMQCPNKPKFASGDEYPNWVRVKTSTKQANGSTTMPRFFSRIFKGPAVTVGACAQAAWGPPAGNAATVFPLALQWQCWDAQVNSLNGYGPPQYSTSNSATYERWFKLTGGNGAAAGCYGSGDLSAGFGWLYFALTSCSTTSGSSFSYGTWTRMDTGNDMPTNCKTPIVPPTTSGSVMNKVIVIPIYDCAWQSSGATGSSWGTQYSTNPTVRGTACSGLAPAGYPTGKYYRIAGFAPYLLTGAFYGSGSASNYDDGQMGSRLTGHCGTIPGTYEERCFYGWFTQRTLLASGEIGDKNTGDFGLNVVKLAG